MYVNKDVPNVCHLRMCMYVSVCMRSFQFYAYTNPAELSMYVCMYVLRRMNVARELDKGNDAYIYFERKQKKNR